MMKLPKPLFDVPSTQRKAKAKKKRNKSRATAVDSALFGEFSHEPHESRDDDGVERPEHPATEEEPFDAVWELARQAAMPGAIVSSNVEGVREQCERLGIEFYEPGEEEDAPD